MKPEVLSFDHVTCASEQDGGLRETSFRLGPGELLLIRLESEASPSSVADLAEGLRPPEGGCVSFLGRDWRDHRPREELRARARIGRVFRRASWISNLDIEENVLLAELHHSGRPDGDVRAEATRLARTLGLEALPADRPHRAPSRTRRLCALVRALLGGPALLLLEQPLRGLPAATMDPLLAQLDEARERGAAVLWTTADERLFADARLHPSLRGELRGNQLRVERTDP